MRGRGSWRRRSRGRPRDRRCLHVACARTGRSAGRRGRRRWGVRAGPASWWWRAGANPGRRRPAARAGRGRPPAGGPAR
ncbi:UNVERIFIED_ORG: hypothetical protein E4P37_19140 [Bacillus sp. AZ43]